MSGGLLVGVFARRHHVGRVCLHVTCVGLLGGLPRSVVGLTIFGFCKLQSSALVIHYLIPRHVIVEVSTDRITAVIPEKHSRESQAES